ncbi:MAG: DNA primase [Bacteroidales bacterium]|jgi:DNA primase|nr:DNA primase [Bacteroidales bacterium]
MIDPGTIDRIMSAADIEEVVSEFVTLRKRGVNLVGLCPFHNEKTPSFSVSRSRGIFKCFGCGKGGNVVHFIMEHEALSYPEALKWLAAKYHIDIQEEEETAEQRQLKDARESMMIVNAFAQQYFADYLWKDPLGQASGYGYLNERGIRDDVARTFGIGFCPEGKDVFTRDALKQGYKMEFLEQTGLTIRRDEWVRDRFAGRLMFPIHNIAGRVIAFGGRLLKYDKSMNTGKYLNSPESEVYHKSQTLYGIFQAKHAIIAADRCFLVEGYTDVISMYQAGVKNVVASSGTSLTTEQIRLVRRFTPNITILYDGDPAGIKASLRGIDMVLEEGLNVRVILLPDGHDPDSFAKSRSSEALQEYLQTHETDFIRFKAELLLKDAGNDPIEKGRTVSNIIQSVAVVPNSVTRSIYIQECSRLLNISEEALYAESRKILMRRTADMAQKNFAESRHTSLPVAPAPSHAQNYQTEEREIIRILLKYFHHHLLTIEGDSPDEVVEVTVGDFVIDEIVNDELYSDNETVNTMFDIFSENRGNKAFNSALFFVHFPDPQISSFASDLLAEKYVASERWHKNGSFLESEEEILDTIVPKIVNEYKAAKIKKMLAELEEEIAKTDDMEQILSLMADCMRLKDVEKQLSLLLGNRQIRG